MHTKFKSRNNIYSLEFTATCVTLIFAKKAVVEDD